jgi:SHS family sialic acid transporter-like MFS transporter
MCMTNEDAPPRPPTILPRTYYMVLLAAFLGWLFDGFEMGLFPIVARPALLDLFSDAENPESLVGPWMGYITALFLLGAALGGLVFGWLGDKVGRVRAMSLSILTYSMFTGMGYFAQEPWHLGAFRFLAALGMGGEWSLGVALVMECWPERYRPLMAGIIGAAANCGFLLVGYVGRAFPVTIDSWRWMWLVGVLPALLVFFIRLFVPESERWKAAVKTGPSAPLREIFQPQLVRSTLLGILFASVALIGTWGTVQWIPVWVDKMVGKDLPSAKGTIGMISALGAIFGCLVGPLVGGKIGRRPAYFLLCLSSLAVCEFLYLSKMQYTPGRSLFADGSSGLSPYLTIPSAFQVTVFFAGFTTAAFYGWLPLFLPELFPTRARATGQGVCFNSGRILAALGAIFGGALVAAFGNDYAKAGATITCIYLVGMAVIWMGPETKGKPLPD